MLPKCKIVLCSNHFSINVDDTLFKFSATICFHKNSFSFKLSVFLTSAGIYWLLKEASRKSPRIFLLPLLAKSLFSVFSKKEVPHPKKLRKCSRKYANKKKREKEREGEGEKSLRKYYYHKFPRFHDVKGVEQKGIKVYSSAEKIVSWLC